MFRLRGREEISVGRTSGREGSAGLRYRLCLAEGGRALARYGVVAGFSARRRTVESRERT